MSRWITYQNDWIDADKVAVIGLRPSGDTRTEGQHIVYLTFTGDDESRRYHFPTEAAARDFIAAITRVPTSRPTYGVPPVADAALDGCLAASPDDPDGLELDDLTPFDEDEVELASAWAKATRPIPHDGNGEAC
jgi:hypothetical protein